MKILILKRDKLGDMLLTTPMISLLRQAMPAAEIHVLANDYNAWVLDGNADVDKVFSYRRVRDGNSINWRALVSQIRQTHTLRGESYDWIIVANGEASHRAIKRAALLGGKRLVSYTDARNKLSVVTDPLPVPIGTHESRRMAALLTPLGVALPATLPVPNFHLSREAMDFAREWLTEQNIMPNGYIALGLGARRAKKQPTTEQIIRWSQHFYEAWGLQTVFMWTPGKNDNPQYPGDDEVAQPVLDAKLPWLHPFRGALKPALGLIWNSRTNLFPDSGLMHFAAASPGGVLGFFAEIEVSPPPSQWAPLGPKATWLEAPKAVAELHDRDVIAALQRLV